VRTKKTNLIKTKFETEIKNLKDIFITIANNIVRKNYIESLFAGIISEN